MSPLVARDGSVMFRDCRIGRVRRSGARWVWVSEGFDSPTGYASRKAAVAALVRFHVARSRREVSA